MQETGVRSLGGEDPLEKWQPTPELLPRESHGQRSLVGYSPRGHKESDTTERLHFHFTWVGVSEECKGILMYLTWVPEEPGIGPKAALLFLDCLASFLYFLPSLYC